jgi:hypothetical protein
VAIRACTVSFRGVSGVRHSVDLDAETVYEAGIRGLALLKKDGWVDAVGTGAELEIQVREPATTHRISVAQLQRWCEGVSVSPAETLRKVKLKQLLR